MKIISVKFLVIAFILMLLISAACVYKAECLTLLSKIQYCNGLLALFLLSVTYIVSNLLILPFGLPLNLLAGMLWGTLGGGILINMLATFVAGISFYLGRWFGYYFLEDLFKKYRFLSKFQYSINRYDWQFISLARINPIVPFGLSNYLFGVIPELSFGHFIIVTALSNFLPCLVFASIGSAVKSFNIGGSHLYSFILQFGIALTLISVLVVLKMMMPRYSEENGR